MGQEFIVSPTKMSRFNYVHSDFDIKELWKWMCSVLWMYINWVWNSDSVLIRAAVQSVVAKLTFLYRDYDIRIVMKKILVVFVMSAGAAHRVMTKMLVLNCDEWLQNCD